MISFKTRNTVTGKELDRLDHFNARRIIHRAVSNLLAVPMELRRNLLKLVLVELAHDVHRGVDVTLRSVHAEDDRGDGDEEGAFDIHENL